eukprot:12965167-Alexandrium_andersonii.AAC.1
MSLAFQCLPEVPLALHRARGVAPRGRSTLGCPFPAWPGPSPLPRRSPARGAMAALRVATTPWGWLRGT